ncbi:hypothetical protein C0991_007951, partial [Blastosporella zonata]
DGCTELLEALTSIPHPNLHSILLVNNDMNEAQYRILNWMDMDKLLPALILLDLALNEDLDSDIIVELVEHMESRGCQVVIDDDENKELLHGDALDSEWDMPFTPSPVDQVKQPGDEPDVDALADLISAGLKINTHTSDVSDV